MPIIESNHATDSNGYPAGGFTRGDGFEIDWSLCSPMDLIDVLRERLTYQQRTATKSHYTAKALDVLGYLGQCIQAGLSKAFKSDQREVTMYRAVHDPLTGRWQVVDADGSWVAGPWLKMRIAQDVARSLNMAERELERELQGQEQ